VKVYTNMSNDQEKVIALSKLEVAVIADLLEFSDGGYLTAVELPDLWAALKAQMVALAES